MLTQVSIFIIAIAFAVLVIFLIKTLKAAQGSLDKVTQTLQDVQKTIDELSYEVKQTVRHANDITADVDHKLKQVEPVMESVRNLGEVLSEVTLAAKQASTALMTRFQKSHSAASNTSRTDHAIKATTPNRPLTATERTVQSYNATYEEPAAKPGKNWLGYVDIAAGVWQKMRQ
ncbi:DUF948 domain-containing protein [Paenibacillus sp. S33]|uniref:DUF948 domain-containing protein n=2 Tax=Paenibacillus TaxID=44249 RepID=A0AAE9L8P2_PAEPO|nr:MULTISPECIES: DUF948 domain-containing protein [Paenibacillus]KAF6629186.1 DUF948 domain-containing protein [Paenibacillus sp. EKM208P]AOK89833.1 hypothetical protein AOU00_08440 [Paenibacillus polymyxa]MBP1172987.1 uncharacterized protein YoxC [Paenibacillus sp. PvR133]MCP3796652.1 DUF948 domain-containing protein [Paenibacillus sp. CH40]MXO78494.1 DUF948 domain-containing protein [Paenibacillus sp. OT2-17]